MSRGTDRPEATLSLRQEMLRSLRRAPATLRDLALDLGLGERDAAEHLAHALRSLGARERLAEDPAACLACGFAFRKRGRLTTPGRCPRCRSERVRPAVYRIEEPGG